MCADIRTDKDMGSTDDHGSGGTMKIGNCLLAWTFLCLLLAPAVFSQDAEMVLDHKELSPHQRSLVRFNHDGHSANIECLRCHHDYDKHGNNKGGDGQLCTACHGKSAEKTRIPLEKAFHAQCKGCHETRRAQGISNTPILCGECHAKK